MGGAGGRFSTVVVIYVCCVHLPAESFISTLNVDILVCNEEGEEKVGWRSGLAGHLITLSRNITSQANGMVPPGKQGGPLISLIVVPIFEKLAPENSLAENIISYWQNQQSLLKTSAI